MKSDLLPVSPVNLGIFFTFTFFSNQFQYHTYGSTLTKGESSGEIVFVRHARKGKSRRDSLVLLMQQDGKHRLLSALYKRLLRKSCWTQVSYPSLTSPGGVCTTSLISSSFVQLMRTWVIACRSLTLSLPVCLLLCLQNQAKGCFYSTCSFRIIVLSFVINFSFLY